MRNLLPFLLLIILSCEQKQKDNRLFWIDETTDERNDFLDMVESSNIETSPDSLRSFLTRDEYFQTGLSDSRLYFEGERVPKQVRFKKYQQLKTNGNYRALILLRIGNEANRNYRFIIRTYSDEWRIIDSYEFAVWDQNIQEFCYGSINNQLTIEKRCGGNETPEIMTVTKKGEILAHHIK